MVRKQINIKPLVVPNGISQSELDSYGRVDYPLFGFKYLADCSFSSCRDGGFFSSFLLRLKKLSVLGWKEIALSGRHGFGMEKIPRTALNHELPSEITPEVPLFAFRAAGNNLPFVGFREGRVFHIVFIEASFGDIYNH